MRVYFNFDYKGNMAYLNMKEQPNRMDTKVIGLDGLLDFLELRLGLHTVRKSEAERLVAYYKCVRDYMNAHKDDPNNQLYNSYKVSPLATSREMLKWRDALAVGGWNQDSPAPSKRLIVLQGVERLFAEKAYPDVNSRQQKIIERLKQQKNLIKDVTFVMPFDVCWLNPVLREIFELTQANGAHIERLSLPEIEGNDNLSQLKRLFTTDQAQSLTLNPDDQTLRIWNFKDEMSAEEYLAMLPDNTFDVSINPNTKLTDNFLHMMGKPVTGSSVSNSAPQVIQLFYTGVAILARPLNINALLQWLYSPIHPLPGKLRYRLAESLARNGGWYSNDVNDRNTPCTQIVQDWIEGKSEAEAGTPISKEEEKDRLYKALVFLPDFKGGSNPYVKGLQLHTFLKELSLWSSQRSAMLAQKNQSDPLIVQLSRLSELCDTLNSLTDDLGDDDTIAYSEIEKHATCLYEPSEFVLYKAQANTRFTIAQPGQVAAKADTILWAGLHDFEPMKVATEFLTPTETNALQNCVRLWDSDNLRKIQQQTMILPLLFCQKQLTLVTVESIGGEKTIKHPLIVRIEQQVNNHQQSTSSPQINESEYVKTSPLTNNAICDNNGIYATIQNANLIEWREHESPTSIEKLIQNPLDYVLEECADICDNGQSDLGNISITKGNVAHAVIQKLFLIPDDKKSGYPDAILSRVKSDYKTVFDKVIETKGAILLLQENAIERRQLFEQLRECIYHLLDIIQQNNLHVVACEEALSGNTLGKPDENTPAMHGFADMVLAKENGQHIIFDFKWTSSKSHYQNLLSENRSSQLAIYAELLSELTNDDPLPTGYFLMPLGQLFSTEPFKSYYAHQLEINEGCEGDLISKIIQSYRYRRNEIMSGNIEMGEGISLHNIQYYNDTEEKGLFPLKPDYGDESVKAVYGFSNYIHLKN